MGQYRCDGDRVGRRHWTPVLVIVGSVVSSLSGKDPAFLALAVADIKASAI
jgi:hypothetical protein